MTAPGLDAEGPAGGHAARRAGIRDRRPDLAVQGAARRRVQGDRGAAPRRDPPPLRRADAAPRAGSPPRSRRPTGSPPITRRRGSPASARPRRGGSSAARRASTPDRLDLKPWPAAVAEKRFLARFARALRRSERVTRAAARPKIAAQAIAGVPMPQVYVCPLSRIAETVAQSNASHLVSLINDNTPVVRPADDPGGEPPLPRHQRHRRADRRHGAARPRSTSSS